MDKAIWTVRTAKLCPKCIKEMEAEYIVYLTHEQQRNPMRIKQYADTATVAMRKASCFGCASTP